MIVKNCIFEKEINTKIFWLSFFFIPCIIFDIYLLLNVCFGIENLRWLYDLYWSDVRNVIILAFIALSPFFSGVYLVDAFKKKKMGYTSPIQYDKSIKHINFKKETIEIFFSDDTPKQKYNYRDIESLKLCIANPKRVRSRYCSTFYMEELFVNFSIGERHFAVRSHLNMDSFTQIIYYSQFVKKFSYEYIETEDEIKILLDDYIQCYIGNNYSNTIKNIFKITHF